jgi:hypothetical protein
MAVRIFAAALLVVRADSLIAIPEGATFGDVRDSTTTDDVDELLPKSPRTARPPDAPF